jgi:DNA-binding MarR family transcriptional regulator
VLCQLDDDPLGAADVAEPVAVLVALQLADELSAAGSQAGVDVFDGECDMADARCVRRRAAACHTLNLSSAITSYYDSIMRAPDGRWTSAISKWMLRRVVYRVTIEFHMPAEIMIEHYRALAELRYQIRQFLCEGDATASKLGLEPQQYMLLLALRGLPEGAKGTIRTLAQRLALKHNSTVELINRMEARQYVRRSRSRDDRRCVLVSLRPRGEKLLEQVARQRITELRATGAALVNAIDALLGHTWRSRTRKRIGNITRESVSKQL